MDGSPQFWNTLFLIFANSILLKFEIIQWISTEFLKYTYTLNYWKLFRCTNISYFCRLLNLEAKIKYSSKQISQDLSYWFFSLCHSIVHSSYSENVFTSIIKDAFLNIINPILHCKILMSTYYHLKE